ncbi:hypothetical protein CL619_02680 [archaeon]|nr:hypothetical protein [archaeon]|tara:strand:- start:360 stop:836 length:477 start_codon:yes stop_codon:yes gene_type:complete
MLNDNIIFSLKQELQETLDHARHLLRRTYPLVQEQKLFLSVFQLLVKFYELFEKYLFELLKKEGMAPKQEVNKVILQRLLLSKEEFLKKQMGLNFELTTLFTQKSLLQELLEAQKTGPADFARKKDYIICEKNYKVRVISESSALQILQVAEKIGRNL